MPPKGLKLPRAWFSTLAALGIGLAASYIILIAPYLEAAWRKLPASDAKQLTTTQALYDKLDTAIYDSLFQLRGPHSTTLNKSALPVPGIPEVAIITLDDRGMAAVNEFYKSHGPPLPRRVYADLVRKLKKAGAVVVGLDVLFISPSGYNRSQSDPDDDREFAVSLKQCGNVVLATAFDASQQAEATFVAQAQDFPIEMLRTAARAVAPTWLAKDNQDGYVRRFHLTEAGPDDPALPAHLRQYPTFATMLAALYWKNHRNANPAIQSMVPQVFDQYLIGELAGGRFLNLPVPFHRLDTQAVRDPTGINICYAGYPGLSSCAIHSIIDVLQPPVSDEQLQTWFRGKIVLVGSWSPADQDFHSTPLVQRAANRIQTGPIALEDQEVDNQNYLAASDRRFGVEVHAHVIHSLLTQHYYRDFDERRRIGLVWMCGLITALMVARLKPVLALIPVIGLITFVAWLAIFSFSHYVFLRPVEIGLATVLAFGLESVYFYSIEDRRARRARNTFQRYVGPKVMVRVLDTDFKPGTVEQRHLTIMFTDVQGFTSLSEKMSPREVVATFNRYLNDMVEIIDRHGGTLDKIMGDGIMAYFNAPLPVDHHERKAVECALEMQASMRQWRELSERLGLPPLKVRIGINAGDVVFGEVGAKRQLGYTVIGDAVNAAARLEPLNKEFGTEILISEVVRNQLDDSFETLYVGELTIRGREEGIRAYTVTGRTTSTS